LKGFGKFCESEKSLGISEQIFVKPVRMPPVVVLRMIPEVQSDILPPTVHPVNESLKKTE